MSQKIEIRKDKIDLPIKDDLDKIHYLSTLSDKRFQNKLSHINDNLDKITEKIKEFVELLSSESRKNDEYISEKIYESLQEIFKVAKKDTEIDFNKLKQKIIKQLDKHLTISKNNKIKTEIEKYIEENISKEFSTPNNQNNQTTPNKKSSTTYTQKTINVKLPKKDTKQIYSNILTNSVFINKINKKIKDTCTTVLNDLKIKNVSKSNLKASKTNKLVLRTFLTNYNSKVEKTIVQTKKSIDKETTKTRTVNDVIRSKIKRVVQKIKRFIIKINPINWYKKARNKLRKLKNRFGSFWGTSFFIVGVPIFLFKIAWKIASFITSIAFKIAKTVAKIAFKLLATVAKLALKIITKVLKTTLFILKGVFKIVTKTLGIVVSIIKKVFNITKGITKFVVKTVSKFLKPLKYLKYLLLTPQGMYVAGLICGFVIKKLTESIWILGKNGKGGLSNLGKKIKGGINEIIVTIKNKINNIAIKIAKKIINRHNKLKAEQLTYTKDRFGVPKINDKENYKKFAKKIELKILEWVKDYANIITDEKNETKWRDLKELFEDDIKATGITNVYNKYKNFSWDDFKNSLNEMVCYLRDIKDNKIMIQLQKFATLSGTGIYEHKIKKQVLTKAASSAIQTGSVILGGVIGSIIPGVGTLIGAGVGGLVGGVISRITEGIMSSKIKLKLNNEQFKSAKNVVEGANEFFRYTNPNTSKYFLEKDELELQLLPAKIKGINTDKEELIGINQIIQKEKENSKTNFYSRRFFKDIAQQRLLKIHRGELIKYDFYTLCKFLNTGDESIFNKYDDRDKLKNLNYTGVKEVDDALKEYANKVELLLEKWINYEANNDGNINRKIEPFIKTLNNIAEKPAFKEYKSAGYKGMIIHNPNVHKTISLKQVMENYPNNPQSLIPNMPYGKTLGDYALSVYAEKAFVSFPTWQSHFSKIQTKYYATDSDYNDHYKYFKEGFKVYVHNKNIKDSSKIYEIFDEYDSKFRNIFFSIPLSTINDEEGKKKIYEIILAEIDKIKKQKEENRNEIIKKRQEQEFENNNKIIYSGLNTNITEKVKETLLQIQEDDSLRKLLNIKDNNDIISCIGISQTLTTILNDIDKLIPKEETTIVIPIDGTKSEDNNPSNVTQ